MRDGQVVHTLTLEECMERMFEVLSEKKLQSDACESCTEILDKRAAGWRKRILGLSGELVYFGTNQRQTAFPT